MPVRRNHPILFLFIKSKFTPKLIIAKTSKKVPTHLENRPKSGKSSISPSER